MSSSLKRSWSDRSCQTRIQKCWFPVRVYWDTGRLGMKLVEQDGVMVIRKTQKGTWADEMKLRIGDELVSINGQAVSQMREEDCRETLLWRRPLRLTFARLCRASATPRLRNRISTRLNEALSFSQSLRNASPAEAAEVVRSRADSLEMRADAGEDDAVNEVVTALLENLEDPRPNQDAPSAKPDISQPASRDEGHQDSQMRVKPTERSEHLRPLETVEPTLPDVEARERQHSIQYSDFEEQHEEVREPSEYEDNFEIDDEENSPVIVDHEPVKPVELSEHLRPSEPVEPALPADVEARERQHSIQYSDFEEQHEEVHEPSEYEDNFEIDDEENSPTHEENLQSDSQSGYPGTMQAAMSPDNEASHPRRVLFADQETVLKGENDCQDAGAQAAHPSLDRKVSFSDDTAGMDAATAKALRRGTGFVSQESLPESESDNEDDEIQAPPVSQERRVSFTEEAGTDSERVQAMRKGTGFVAMRDLPESDDEEGEEGEEGDDEIQAPATSSERKVSFSQEAGTSGTDSETAKAMRKGTGHVPMSAIARLASDEDTGDEVDEIRHVSFSEDAEDRAQNATQSSSVRKGTGFVAAQNLPESDDDEDEEDEIQAPPVSQERRVSFTEEAGADSERVQAMRKGTGFVPMKDLPDSDDEVDPEDEDAYDADDFEDEEV